MNFLSLDPSLRTRNQVSSIAPAPQLGNLTKASLEAYMKALKTSGEGFQSMTAIHSSVMAERLMKFLTANKGKFTEQQINLVYQVARENKLIGNDDKSKDFKNLALLIQNISVNAFNQSKNVEHPLVSAELQDDREEVLVANESKKKISSAFNTIKNRIQSLKLPSPFFMKCAAAALVTIAGIAAGVTLFDNENSRDASNKAQESLKANVRVYRDQFDFGSAMKNQTGSKNWIKVGDVCGENLVGITYDFSPLLKLKGEALDKDIAACFNNIDKIVSKGFPNHFAYQLEASFSGREDEPIVNDWKFKNDININGTENIKSKEFPKSRADESKFKAVLLGC